MELRKTLILDSAEPLSKAAAYLKEEGAVILTKNGKYYGMVDQNSLSKGIRDPLTTKCETVVSKPPVLSGTADVFEQANAFLVGHFRALPVVGDNEEPLGIATRVGVLSELSDSQVLPGQKVAELMSSPVYTINVRDIISKAKRVMKETGTHRLVVTNAQGFPAGVISDLDISTWVTRGNSASGRKDVFSNENSKVESMCISEFLNPDVATIGQASSLGEAVTKMVKNRVSALVVLADNKKPAGILSALDVFRLIQDAAKPKQMITISGLSENSKQYYKPIEEKIAHSLARFSKSFSVKNASVHVKENKSTFMINLLVETESGRVAIKHERPDLKVAIDEVAAELSEQLRKMKEKRNPKARARHGGDE